MARGRCDGAVDDIGETVEHLKFVGNFDSFRAVCVNARQPGHKIIEIRAVLEKLPTPVGLRSGLQILQTCCCQFSLPLAASRVADEYTCLVRAMRVKVG